MSFQLVTTNNLPTSQSDEVFASLVNTATYTGYISLVQGSSALAKPPCKLPIGTYAYVMDKKPTSLGEKFKAVICAWRPTARIVDKRGQDTKITSFHNLNDPRFQEIKTIAESSSKQEDENYLNYWGFEYLLWVPELRKFATFYCNSISSRIAAGRSIHPNVSKMESGDIKVVEFGVDFVQKKYSYYVIECEEVAFDLGDNVPSDAEFNKVYTDFLNATDSEEVAEEVTPDDENER